jgi:hypothetical protein
MSQVSVPNPPQTAPMPQAKPPVAPANRFAAPLDMAFLRRCLVSTLGLGVAFSVLLLAWSKSPFVAASYFGGALFGATMLASLMSFVARIAAAKTGVPYRGVDAKVPVWLVAGVKYIGMGVVAWGVASRGWAQPFAFVIGVALVQLVIVAKVLGRMLASKNVAEVYINNAR